MSLCGNGNGGDAGRFSAILRRLGQEHKFSVKSGDFYCSLKDARWNRVQFDHAIMYKGKLRLIEFDDEDYEGKNHPTVRKRYTPAACRMSPSASSSAVTSTNTGILRETLRSKY
jgi:hypothetical protein